MTDHCNRRSDLIGLCPEIVPSLVCAPKSAPLIGRAISGHKLFRGTNGSS